MVDATMTTAEEMEPSPAAASPSAPEPSKDEKEVTAARTALVKQWQDRIDRAKKHFAKDFQRMRANMQFAIDGADKEWLAADNYVVPIVNRHINQAVAQLYAKDPRAQASRRRRLMYTVWDGTQESLVAATQAAMPPVDPMTGAPMIDPMTGMPMEGDPNALALLQEIEQVKAENAMIDKLAETLTILWRYYVGEQASGFKQQAKALVRRTKVCGVGYVKLAFQRELKKNPETVAAIDDAAGQLAAIQQGLRALKDGEIEESSARAEELRLLMKQLDAQLYIIAREGPIFDFPRATEVLIDPACRHLKTFAGARWVATWFDMHPDDIEETYGVDIRGRYTALTANREDPTVKVRQKEGDDKEPGMARVYEIQDKKLGQTCTICEGFPDFLKEPAEPDVKIERFWTLFPLVFNEVESDEKLYPPSDVQLLRHTQNEYNRSRQGLREHREANRPFYVAPKGVLSEADKKKVGTHASHSLLELQALKPGQKADELFQRGPSAPIDPAQYEVESHFQDVLRTVGSQEANLGGTSNATATEASIAENSHSSSRDDNIDDLDDMLTELSRATGHLMLMELAKETVVEIVGPGAVWPEVQGNREQIAKDLLLDIKAGSSGRPNAAADLAKLERAMPYLLQTPGVNPKPVIEKYANLLDVDMEDLYVEGLPSMTSMNQAKQPNLGADPAADPNAQGPAGEQNAPASGEGNDAPQPAFPAA